LQLIFLIQIADNLSKAVGVGVASQQLMPTDEQFGLPARIATTEGASLSMLMKSWLLLWNRNQWFALAANCLDKLVSFSRRSMDMKTSIPPVLITIALVCFGLLPKGHGVLPPPDGGYPGFNTAEGTKALQSLTTGSANTAVGWYSLFSNAEGSFNTATGAGALLFNTANENTAFGAAALLLNTDGWGNTAVGTTALSNNTEGIANTAIGARALYSNTAGGFNMAIGSSALANNINGSSNTAVGVSALGNSAGSFNIAVGNNAGLNIDGDGNVCIGASGESGVNNSTYIQNVNTTEQSPAAGVAFVTVRLSDGRLGYQPPVMRSASSELQKTVEELKSTVARQEAIIAQQRKGMEVLTARLNDQTSQIQKVSAQLEASKPATQVVNNP
jgi:uncharacterized coiled-coil protein SlyX